MHIYKSQGLIIHSSIYFPELLECTSKNVTPQVLIQYGEFEIPEENTCYKEVFSYFDEVKLNHDTAYLLWNNTKICSVSKGNRIIINPKTGLNQEYLRTIILGSAFGILLHQIGRLVLHGNAVKMHKFAIAFLGPSGRGKSTTSLALHKKGYPLLSDDIISIEFDENNSPLLFSNFPLIKLWPEVIKYFQEDPDIIPKIHLNTDKRYYLTQDNFSNITIPLKSIYSIHKSDKNFIKEIKPQEAMIELTKSSYCLRMFNKKEMSKNLIQCSKIINNISLKCLKINHSFNKLSKIVEIIESDNIGKISSNLET